MKAAFKLGARVRFKLKDGSLGALATLSAPAEGSRCTIGDNYDRPQPHYLGEGFYHITTIPDRRQLIAHENNLVLVDEKGEEIRDRSDH